MTKKVQYPFPLMKIAEIVKCMEYMNVSIGEQDISKPNPVKIQKVYEGVLEIFKGVPRDQFQKPNHDILDMLEYPDLHVNSLPLISFYKTFGKFIEDLGVHNFGLKDIVQPEPKNVVIVLSAIINFARFREDQLVLFEEKSQESDNLIERKRNLEHTNSELKESIQNIRNQRKEEEPAVENLTGINEKLMNELKDLHKIQVGITEELESQKEKKSALSDQLTNNQYLLMNLKQDCQKLKSRIVESPEKLVKNIETLNLSVSQEKLNVASFERKNREIQTKIESFTLVEKDSQDCLFAIKECEAAMEKYTEAVKMLDDLKRQVSQGHLDLKDLQIKDQQMNRQLIAVQEKISSSRNQNDAKKTIMEEKLHLLQQQYIVVSSELAKTKQKIEENNKKMESMKAKMVEKKREHSIVVETIQESYEKMRDHLNEYMESFRSIMV